MSDENRYNPYQYGTGQEPEKEVQQYCDVKACL